MASFWMSLDEQRRIEAHARALGVDAYQIHNLTYAEAVDRLLETVATRQGKRDDEEGEPCTR